MKNTAKPLLWDCIIIGGGPAGIMAGIYLARYRRNVLIYDTYESRAATIPLSHNYPGFIEGISGKELLKNLRKQLSFYKVPLIKEEIKSLKKFNKNIFSIQTCNDTLYAKNIILATGVKDIEPKLADIEDGIQKGLIRHCPVCDAYEVINKKIAVISKGKDGLGEALFLREYTNDVTLITIGTLDSWSTKELKIIEKSNITIISQAIKTIKLSSKFSKITFHNQKVMQFDCLYSALGCKKNNQLIRDLKLKLKDDSLIVNKDQQTSIQGLFAAGDIVSGLNQMCVAISQAAIAATAIHNRCRRYKI